MTNSARPNLGGLFNGSTPAQQPSRIADPAAGPRLISAIPIQQVPIEEVPIQEVPIQEVPIRAAAGEPTTESALDVSAEPAGWVDPVNLVNQYFQFLRALLDMNQRWAVACTSAVVAMPRRVGLHR
jgi:hypothetical protein